jgi:hypothetical protein
VVHPNWRILAAMNMYDKSYLFAMSFAFMRRFAFIDVDLPDEATYDALLERWSNQFGLPLDAGAGAGTDAAATVRQTVTRLLRRDGAVMSRRAIGPAIVRDMLAYAGDRYAQVSAQPGAAEALLPDLICEAFLLFVVPQLDGLDREGILTVYRYANRLFGGASGLTSVLARIRLLYPHVALDDWESHGAEQPGAAASQ